MQDLIDLAPQAATSYSAVFALYRRVVYYPGRHRGAPDTSQTSRVEGDNAPVGNISHV